jgi:hypothetical protein
MYHNVVVVVVVEDDKVDSLKVMVQYLLIDEQMEFSML